MDGPALRGLRAARGQRVLASEETNKSSQSKESSRAGSHCPGTCLSLTGTWLLFWKMGLGCPHTQGNASREHELLKMMSCQG